VLETMRALKVLKVFKQSRTHVAVVVNQHGATEGMVTMHDTLEAVLGDLPAMGESPKPMPRLGDDGSRLVDGIIPVFEFKELLQIDLIVGSLCPKGYQRESFAGRKPLPLTSERIEGLRSFVETSMKKLDVPGAGFALIDQGKVVYEGGIGVKELGKRIASTRTRCSWPHPTPKV
jgi:CBS domain containing-hemolysin-like protein